MELHAGDRYRIEVRPGGLLKGLFRRRSAQPQVTSAGSKSPLRPAKQGVGGTVSIVDLGGNVVWTRSCETPSERNDLVRLIQTQVFPARLEDFEHWLRTEGRDGGGLRS